MIQLLGIIEQLVARGHIETAHWDSAHAQRTPDGSVRLDLPITPNTTLDKREKIQRWLEEYRQDHQRIEVELPNPPIKGNRGYIRITHHGNSQANADDIETELKRKGITPVTVEKFGTHPKEIGKTDAKAGPKNRTGTFKITQKPSRN